MAAEVYTARESGVSSLNGEKVGGRTVPRLYSTERNEDYPQSLKLGISTRESTAEVDKTILESTMGQLSDGIWENSRQMEKYWSGARFSQDEKGNVELRYKRVSSERIPKWRRGHIEYDMKIKYSGYDGMSERNARDFVAGKIKAVFNTEKKDRPSIGKWSEDNRTVMDYLGHGANPVTVADAYNLYKRLKS